MLAGVVVLALAGFAAAGVFAVDGFSIALTTTIGPEPPPSTSPSPDPAPTPPPPPVVATPPPPPPPTHALAVAPKPKPKPHRHPKVVEPAAPDPVPISRGAGGPARPDLGKLVATPVSFHASSSAAPKLAPPTATSPSKARLFFLAAIALGFVLVLTSALPRATLRPAVVYEVVTVHRLDLALVGFAIVGLVGALYLLTG